ncbi:hypothetical protein crov351 [Cafeteria roenbergensis virus]|uniref:Uncharacterized protein n=1 Tax=Cafeteria roenbergensis virus (strain BV-PW1) TaxID=693272 RepID=E3T5C2_CROVB|nr:hypothetical protein crov351 [Cafeteria roenbergensis virus BV-PW1]ADO67385.1 hypothetical protein crov351 [Cafeteria roenbergensis virus BV-PW1]
MDSYKRPKKTFQDNLSQQDIIKYLKDYAPVKNAYDLPINTHVRYFVTKNDKKEFRMGGYISKMDPVKGYIMLTNGKINWSVQVKDAEIFYKLEIDDIRNEYEEKIKKYKKKIRKLEETLQEIIKKLKSKK